MADSMVIPESPHLQLGRTRALIGGDLHLGHGGRRERRIKQLDVRCFASFDKDFTFSPGSALRLEAIFLDF